MISTRAGGPAPTAKLAPVLRVLAPNPSDEIFGSKTVLLDAKRWDEAIALYDDVKGYGFQKKDANRDLSLELDPPAKNKNGEPLIDPERQAALRERLREMLSV